jgi:hypothetical protein
MNSRKRRIDHADIKTNLKREKRQRGVEKARRITEHRLLRTHKKCSSKEFETKLKLLEKNKRRRTVLEKK